MDDKISLKFTAAAAAILISTSCSANELEQENVAASASGNELKVCEDCPTFMKVPEPPSELRSIKYVAKYPITWNDYFVAHDAGACELPTVNRRDQNEVRRRADYFRVDWPASLLRVGDINCYLNWLSKKSGYKFDIPTEAEWEWFALAGSKTLFPWGDELDVSKAAVKGTPQPSERISALTGKSIPILVHGVEVGHFPPNAWGLHDVVGNQFELTSTARSGEIWFVRNKKPKPQKGRVEGLSIVLKGYNWYSQSLTKEGVKKRSSVRLTNDRFSAGPAVRVIILEGDK